MSRTIVSKRPTQNLVPTTKGKEYQIIDSNPRPLGQASSANQTSQNFFLPLSHLKKTKEKSLKTLEVSRNRDVTEQSTEILKTKKPDYTASMEMFRINALIPSVKYPTLSPTAESRPLSPKFLSNFKPKKANRKLESSMKQSASIKQVPGLNAKAFPVQVMSP